MALKQLRTAAAHVVHVVNPTERDMAEVVSICHLHPHDKERLFGNAKQPTALAYGQYHAWLLPWPVYDAERNDINLAEIDLVVADELLVIISKGAVPTTEFYEGLLTRTTTPNHNSAAALANQLLLDLSKWSKQQVAEFAHSLSPSSVDEDGRQYGAALQGLATFIDAQSPALTDQQQIPMEMAVQWKLVSHFLERSAEKISQQPRTPLRSLSQAQLAWPRLAQGYALVSVVLALLVLFAATH